MRQGLIASHKSSRHALLDILAWPPGSSRPAFHDTKCTTQVRCCQLPQVGNPPPGNITQFFDGLVTITDPQLFSDTSAKIRASIVGSVIAATGEQSEVEG
jgi:hypothetical protein